MKKILMMTVIAVTITTTAMPVHAWNVTACYNTVTGISYTKSIPETWGELFSWRGLRNLVHFEPVVALTQRCQDFD